MKRIGIIGSRSRNSSEDFKILIGVLMNILEEGDTFVSGGCRKGGDYFAELLAKKYKIPIEIFKPETEPGCSRNEYARAAYKRNELIAANSDILVALVSENRLGGTEHTIKKFIQMKENVADRNLIII